MTSKYTKKYSSPLIINEMQSKTKNRKYYEELIRRWRNSDLQWNVNWYNHSRKQSSSTWWNNVFTCSLTQKSHFWIFTPKETLWFLFGHVWECFLQRCCESREWKVTHMLWGNGIKCSGYICYSQNHVVLTEKKSDICNSIFIYT